MSSDSRIVPSPEAFGFDLSPQAGRGDPSRGCSSYSDFRFNFQTANSVENRHSGALECAPDGIFAKQSRARPRSFRGDAKHRTRNLEIPRCAIAHLRSGPADHPGMTASGLLRRFRLRSLSYDEQVALHDDGALIQTRVHDLAAPMRPSH